MLAQARICPKCGVAHNRSQGYCRACHAAYMRRWRPGHPLTAAQRVKMNCRSYANIYQRRGKLAPKACSVCGNPNAEKHHASYQRPLAVDWLCRACHLKLHAPHVEHPRSLGARHRRQKISSDGAKAHGAIASRPRRAHKTPRVEGTKGGHP